MSDAVFHPGYRQHFRTHTAHIGRGARVFSGVTALGQGVQYMPPPRGRNSFTPISELGLLTSYFSQNSRLFDRFFVKDACIKFYEKPTK
jgi:hypothetical protein